MENLMITLVISHVILIIFNLEIFVRRRKLKRALKAVKSQNARGWYERVKADEHNKRSEHDKKE